MWLAALILILSSVLFFLYFQATCQHILRREFDQEYSHAIADANRLEFPLVSRGLEDFGAPVDYPRLRMMLRCDFLALTYLLKNAVNINQRCSAEEQLLIVYFRLLFLSFITRHLLRLQEKPAILKLTKVLQYFANVLGQRVNTLRFADLTAPEYLLKP